MSEKREAFVMVVCGKKGVGKTVSTIEQIYDYVQGNIAKGRAPRKALIFDVNNEFSSFWYHGETHSIKRLLIKDIPLFSAHKSVEVRRIAPYFDNDEKMTTKDMQDVLHIILENFRNGLLLVEDINKYVGDNMQQDLIGSLATVRHIGIDLIAHYQSIGRAANPKLLGNTKYIRLHKTNDSVSRHEQKFQEKAEILSIAESIVNKKHKEGLKRFYLYVDIDDSKILSGRNDKITKKDIEEAISEYVSMNYNTLSKKYINRVDKKGKALYTKTTVIKKIEDDIREEYFS
jgi:hypothetical protein